jgi:predicted phage tail protein
MPRSLSPSAAVCSLRLEGALEEIVGSSSLELAVSSPSEAVRALCVQFPRARRVIDGAEWLVEVDGEPVDLQALVAVRPMSEVALRPALAGAADGKAGPAKLILGSLLIFAAFAGAAALGGVQLAGQLGGGTALKLGLTAKFLGVSLGTYAKLGALVALSGIVRTMQPSPNTDWSDLENDPPSFTFGSIGQQVFQGAPIPIAYGEAAAGSVQVSVFERTIEKYGSVGGSPFKTEYTYESEIQPLDVISEGPIDGIVDGLQGVFFGDQRVNAVEGGENFPNVDLIERKGVAHDDDDGGAAAALGRPTDVGLTIRYDNNTTSDEGAVEWTVTDPAVDETWATVTIGPVYQNVLGDLGGGEIHFDMEIRPSGGSWQGAIAPNHWDQFWGSNGWYYALEEDGDEVWIGNSAAGSGGGRGGRPGGIWARWWVVHDGALPDGDLDHGDQVTGYVEVGLSNSQTVPPTTWHKFPAVGLFREDYTADATLHGSMPGPTARGVAKCERMIGYTEIPGWTDTDEVWVRVGHEGATEYPGKTFYAVTSIGGIGNWRNNLFWGMWSEHYNEVAWVTEPMDVVLKSGPLSHYGSPPYDVRVKALVRTDEDTPANWSNTGILKRHTEIIRTPTTMPYSATANLTIPASATDGQNPRRAYRMRGRTVRIPSNYNPTTRVYTGTWDGLYAADEAWTDNPAWCLLDYLTATRYGMGLADDQIDKWSLYECAQRCDESVFAYPSGTEPRYRFGHVFQKREDALAIATAIASAMDVTLFWADGRVYFSQNAPRDPVRIFSPANVVAGEFSYSGASMQATKSVALVGWVDPADPFDERVATVERPFVESRFGRRTLEIQAMGAISEGQALRKGRLELLSAEHESEIVTFRLSLAEMNLAPGDIVAISDPARTTARLAGRIAGWRSFGTEITADKFVSANEASDGDELWILYTDGSLHSETLDGFTGGNGLTVDTGFDEARLREGMPWMIAAPSLETWRVVSSEDAGDSQFVIEAHRVYPDLWTEIEDYADQGSPLSPALPSAPPNPGISTWNWQLYYSDELDTVHASLSVRCNLVTDAQATRPDWVEFEPDAADAAAFARGFYEFGPAGGEIDLLSIPSGWNVAGQIRGWDMARTAASAWVATGQGDVDLSSPTPGALVFSREIQNEEDGTVTILVDWNAASGADWYVAIASHNGETVEDARWRVEPDYRRAQFTWEAGETDYTIRIVGRNANRIGGAAASTYTP